MNIDLLLTAQKEAGLVSDTDFENQVAGVMYDPQSSQMTLEFADMDALELNIPIGADVAPYLAHTYEIHVAIMTRGQIVSSRQVPLILLNDPFGGGQRQNFARKPGKSVLALESFMKRAVAGQPVHREDLGDENRAGAVMGGMSAALVQFAPQLARQRTMEAAPRTPAPTHAPSLGPGGMKGGGGGHRPPPRQTTYYEDDED